MNLATMNLNELKYAAWTGLTRDLSINKRNLALGAASIALVMSGTVHPSIILSGTAGWNLDNVVPGLTIPPADPDGDYESVVYDRDVTAGTAGANTYSKMTYGGGESLHPGIKVMNGADQGGFPTIPELDAGSNASNCIMASSYTYCDGPRQSGKRFKQQITGIGPIDLVFNVEDDPIETEYRAFQRLVNQTGVSLGGFVLELGFGVGGAFTPSSANDGLSLTPRGSQNPTQFPFGLFGEDGSMGRIGGFFDGTERSLFDTVFTEDSITTTGILGAYDDYFGYWLPQADAPIGLLFDDDNDPSTDALVLAFFNDDLGQWERRRFVDESCEVVPEVLDPAVRGTLFDSFGDIDIYENATAETNCSGAIAGTQIEEAPIEDVANLNVNYFLQVGAADLWPTYDIIDNTATFTIRVTGLTAPIPVPATMALLVAGLGGIAFAARRRAAHRKAA